MNHIGDGNKMVETPRTDAAYFKPHATMYDLAGEMKLMERELSAANERIRNLEDESADYLWQCATLKAQNCNMAEALQLMKAALECAFPECEYLHHKKAHQHARGGKCVPEELVRMAQKISTTQTK